MGSKLKMRAYKFSPETLSDLDYMSGALGINNSAVVRLSIRFLRVYLSRLALGSYEELYTNLQAALKKEDVA